MKYFEFYLLEHVDKSLRYAHAALKTLARDLNSQELTEAVEFLDKAYEKIGRVYVDAEIEWGREDDSC